MIKSINEPEFSREVMLTPNSLNQPAPLPEGPPTVDGINPTEAAEGTASQLIVVHGTNFTEGCVVNFGGVDQPTTFERSDKINATVALAGAPVGEYPVVVKLLGASSPPQTFTVHAGVGSTGLADDRGDYMDPDELEDELEQAKEDGDFKSMHHSRPAKGKRR